MAEALETAITDNVLTCSICLEEFKDPRVLPCFHTFCFDCISEHAQRYLPRRPKFPCPLCKEVIRVPARGLTQLQRNFSFCRTKEIIAQEKEKRTLEKEQANVVATTQVIAQMTSSCEKHPNSELKYYCEDDDTVVCGDCTSSDHYRHGIVPIAKTAKNNRENIHAALMKTMKTTDRFKEAVAMERDIETEDTFIKTDAVKEIKKQADSMRKLINKREETLISEMNSAYNVRKRQNEANKDVLELQSASLQSACDFALELITNGTDSDVMVLAKPLIENLAAMEKTPVPTLDTTTRMSYSPGEISAAGIEAMLGQLTVQSPTPNPRSAPHSFLKKPVCLQSFSPKMADDAEIKILGLATREEQVVVVDSGNSRIKMFTHAGDYKSDIKMNMAFDVAVSQSGYLYITSQDDKCVKMYSVGDSGQLSTIPLSMCEYPEYISANSVNDNVVISDSGNHCIHVLSPTGDQLYQYGRKGRGDGQLNIPQGVCTDSYGHIFIADYGNHRVVALSPHGQFLRYIITKDDGLKTPTALAISSAGQLVVGDDMGKVKTFQYLNSTRCSLM
ncbi:tripartite motif-containing protein 2-like [Lingula anatina]|uniref:Tripartite motif-containing protein 2-like n=1 Tax=Lingula anatina TaxID=7574 RepID=A0A1S3JDG6_LINAN|nr:tripartite motif-containing protein 2-like [Lingula anatina]|eukprot:XP_013407929.1 tripartite motif-containing protein 2-like [Lingula anatina]